MKNKALVVATHRVNAARKEPFVPQTLSDKPGAVVVYEPDDGFYVRDSKTGRGNESHYTDAVEAARDLAQRWLDARPQVQP